MVSTLYLRHSRQRYKLPRILLGHVHLFNLTQSYCAMIELSCNRHSIYYSAICTYSMNSYVDVCMIQSSRNLLIIVIVISDEEYFSKVGYTGK